MARRELSFIEKIAIIIMRMFRGIRIYFKRMDRGKRIALQIGILSLVGGTLIGNAIGKASASKAAEKTAQEAVGKVTEEKVAKKETKGEEPEAAKEPVKEVPWNLVLVNDSHKMGEGYVPELVDTGSYSIDARAADAAARMLQAAKDEGMSMIVCSSYRSVEKQTQVFNTTVQENLAGGSDYWAAYDKTRKEVALPGSSEHGMGLALDIVSTEYELLDEKQADTKEAKWLEANCYKYGFILRYPADKIDETGIIYEPWHYRYVGEEDAKKIMESGVTLETYLRENYNVN